jgi:cytochrome o ubiquinol oxidase operon protein cyoD
MIDHTSYKSYFIGFFISIILTLASYYIVTQKLLGECNTYISIVSLAVVQLFIQIVYFLHINSEGKPRWNLISMIAAIAMVVIVVAGSVWVMYNMNANMIV